MKRVASEILTIHNKKMKKAVLYFADQIISFIFSVLLFISLSPVFNFIFSQILLSHLRLEGNSQVLSAGDIDSASSVTRYAMIVGAFLCLLVGTSVYHLFVRRKIWRFYTSSEQKSTLGSIASFAVIPVMALTFGLVSFGNGETCAPTELTFSIPANEMASGANDTSSPGSCRGLVYFHGREGRTKMDKDGYATCGNYHCGTLTYGDGRQKENHCSVYASCRSGKAKAVGYTW